VILATTSSGSRMNSSVNRMTRDSPRSSTSCRTPWISRRCRCSHSPHVSRRLRGEPVAPQPPLARRTCSVAAAACAANQQRRSRNLRANQQHRGEGWPCCLGNRAPEAGPQRREGRGAVRTPLFQRPEGCYTGCGSCRRAGIKDDARSGEHPGLCISERWREEPAKPPSAGARNRQNRRALARAALTVIRASAHRSAELGEGLFALPNPSFPSPHGGEGAGGRGAAAHGYSTDGAQIRGIHAAARDPRHRRG
jgi:hypothetical protein